MYRYLFSTTFVRIYGAILGVFLLSVIAFSQFWSYADRSSSIEDFVSDTDRLAKILIDVRHEHPNQLPLVSHAIESLLYQSSAIYSESQLENALSQSVLVDYVGNTAVYIDDTQKIMRAVYPITETGDWMVISDLPHDLESAEITENLRTQILREQSKSRFNRQTALALALACFVATALILLMAINRLSGHIRELSTASRAFSQGNHKARMNTNLPTPLDELASSFNRMAEDLAAAMQEQAIMSNALSHELRTPLTKLRLATGIAAKKCDDDEVLPLIAAMDGYVDELDHLTNSILTIAKLQHQGQQAMSFESLAIVRLTRERAEDIARLNTDKHITVSGEDSSAVRGDPFYLQLALDNLLKNALTYCHTQVAVQVRPHGDDHVDIAVGDDGPGIPLEQAGSLFAPFSRLDRSRDRRSGGYGLGLAIARSVAISHGGSIQTGTSELGGASFVLRLPRVQKAAL